MQLKVAHISTTGTFMPEYYSSHEYVLCRGLAKLGHDVTLFVTDRPPKWQTIGSERTEKGIEGFDGFTVYRLHAGPEVGIVPLVPGLFPTLVRMRFDIIHAHDFYAASSFYAALASKARRTSFILTQHNDQLPAKTVNALLYLFDSRTFGRYVLSQARQIIALNTAAKAHLVAVGADKSRIEIVPTAVDTQVFSPNQRNLLEAKWGISQPAVLFVGRLVEDKGVKYLIRAFAEVVEEVDEAKLVIVGRGPQERALRKLVEDLQLSNVYFLGPVAAKLMPNVYAGCDVLVLPSLHEPFGNVVIEAMSAGRAVIGSYVGGMKDTIVHGMTGYHIQPGDVKQLSSYLIRLLEDASLKNELAGNARRAAVDNYSLELVLQRIEKIYLDALGNGD